MAQYRKAILEGKPKKELLFILGIPIFVLSLLITACTVQPVMETEWTPVPGITTGATRITPLPQPPTSVATRPKEPTLEAFPAYTPDSSNPPITGTLDSVTPNLPPTSTPTGLHIPSPTVPAENLTTYTVQSGDTLFNIAARFNVDLATLIAMNHIASDLIYPGQILLLPGEHILEPTRTIPAWHPSPLEGDLNVIYSGTVERSRFTLHYRPVIPPADDPELLADWADEALAHLEGLLHTTLSGRFDIYVAGNLFALPNQALRGRSFSVHRRFFFLHDGTGNRADQRYILAHELTHLFTWNTFGAPGSAMLSEGVAVYAGMSFIAGEAHLPLQQFCLAYLKVDRLPRISQWLPYEGHIRNLENYYGAGCFVAYLIETYGPSAFGRVYSSLDFGGVYGKTLPTLEAEWIAALYTTSSELTFAPHDLVLAVEQVKQAYERLFVGFSGTSAELAAYQQLDSVRIALVEGRLDAVKAYFE